MGRSILSSLLVTALLLQTALGQDVQSVVREMPHTSEVLTDAEYAQRVKTFQYNLDSVPKGKVAQPADAGKVDSISRQIVNGNSAGNCSLIPWQVFVLQDRSYICGGSILSGIWILTAAHCVLGRSMFEIYAGTFNRQIPEAGRMIFGTNLKFIHPNYSDSNLNNDVALLKLYSAIPMGRTDFPCVRAIRLPKRTDAKLSFSGMWALVSGWGRNQNGSTTATLNWANRTVIPNADCSAVYGTNVIINSTICTSTKDNVGTCQGDSGGPLVIRERDNLWTQIGVVSFVSSNGCTAGPSGYARLASFLGWVSQVSGLRVR